MARGKPRSIRLEPRHIRAVKKAQAAMKARHAAKLGKKLSEVTISWDEAARECLLSGSQLIAG